MLFPVRKILTVVEEIHHDLGPAPETPAVKGAVAAVVGNPYVGRWVEDLSPAVDELRALGERLGNILISHLGGDPSRIDGYGKGTIVGSAGEIEHGAMWHIPGGGGMRAALGKGTSIVPSTKKVALMPASSNRSRRCSRRRRPKCWPRCRLPRSHKMKRTTWKVSSCWRRACLSYPQRDCR